MNGRKVGDQFLAPGYTEYAKRIQSQTYDVTGLVRAGANGLGAALGDRDDLACALLSKKDYPSWGYEIGKGATTIWECWNSIQPDGSFGPVDMNSFNHYAYGAVADWMHQHIGGIRIAEAGYRKSVIEPRVGGGLTHADGSLDTVYGTLSHSWSLTGRDLTMTVTVPANTTTDVVIPSSEPVSESGRPLRVGGGILGVAHGPAKTVLTVGSGRYSFTTRLPGSPRR